MRNKDGAKKLDKIGLEISSGENKLKRGRERGGIDMYK
jgi:hypothetical protein